jgi:hypothetical protein
MRRSGRSRSSFDRILTMKMSCKEYSHCASPRFMSVESNYAQCGLIDSVQDFILSDPPILNSVKLLPSSANDRPFRASAVECSCMEEEQENRHTEKPRLPSRIEGLQTLQLHPLNGSRLCSGPPPCPASTPSSCPQPSLLLSPRLGYHVLIEGEPSRGSWKSPGRLPLTEIVRMLSTNLIRQYITRDCHDRLNA